MWLDEQEIKQFASMILIKATYNDVLYKSHDTYYGAMGVLGGKPSPEQNKIKGCVDKYFTSSMQLKYQLCRKGEILYFRGEAT